MTTAYETLCDRLRQEPRRWLITGAAGFIGSNLLERLLELGQHVVGVDNFITGHRANLEDACSRTASGARFEFIEGDICDPSVCERAVVGADYVLHQAALGSVPRSVDNPGASHASNVDGFVNLIDAARRASVKRFVYASSSSVYGTDTSDVKSEERIGKPLSPYAATKLIDEVYADVFTRVYGIETAGLRYFNVFGARQDPDGPYAAVIPRWTQHLLDDEPCLLFGEGSKSRDFCYIANVVQANLLAATAPSEAAEARVFNIACGERTTLLSLFELIRERVAQHHPRARSTDLSARPPQVGDIPHSLADISRARQYLGYEPTHDIARGLDETTNWYMARNDARPSASAHAGKSTTASLGTDA
ncbi:MAG TPA: SDR family oxidoreductase [Polyangiaceae bacterium]|nr:SDR family oxidoreductase [Polyangiaceae bacterium]